MDPIGWKNELNRLLDKVEEQSTESLAKINQRFMALGLPFDDEFQQNVVKMANIRCVISVCWFKFRYWLAKTKSTT